MTKEALADRLTNYSDGLVAATFVFMTGIGAGIGDDDMRCSIASVVPTMVIFVGVAGATILYSLRWMRLSAERLRADLEIDDDVIKLQARLHLVRVGLTAAFLGVALFLLMNAPSQIACRSVF